MVRQHVLVLGAGFGGLELATRLSEAVADEAHVTLIDQNDSFVFGFSKLEIMIGRRATDTLRFRYADIAKPGVEFRQEHVTSIDPVARRVVTDANTYESDILVVALGADYEPSATPGFPEDGHEFYSVGGAERLRDTLGSFVGGRVVIAVLGVPFKCPPAPFEGALMLHEYLVERGLREATHIEVISPMESPIPVSPPTSEAILKALAERDIGYTPGHRVRELDPSAHVARTRERTLPYDLFIGIPVHRVPDVVERSGLTQGGTDGWVAVEPRSLSTRFPKVFALGDCADAPVPRAGVFAETAARAVATQVIAAIRGEGRTLPYDGIGSCYIEFGDGMVGKVDADFLSGPSPTAPFLAPSRELAAEKQRYAAERRTRWFGT
jgi:sulfide:quinone oxidoreductase